MCQSEIVRKPQRNVVMIAEVQVGIVGDGDAGVRAFVVCIDVDRFRIGGHDESEVTVKLKWNRRAIHFIRKRNPKETLETLNVRLHK